MSYHDGIRAREITDSTTKLKVSLYLNLFINESILVHNFLHCDLHCGNYKIDMSDEDEPKIIIYDCGIFTETCDVVKNKNIIGYLLDANFLGVLDEISKSPDGIENLKKIVEPIQNNTEVEASVRLSWFLTALLESRVKVDDSLVRMIQGLAITGSTPLASGDVLTGTFKNDRNGDKSLLLFAFLCVSHNSGKFVKLAEFYKIWIDESPRHTETFLNWLQKKYSHQDSEIFYESMCDIFDITHSPLNYPDVRST
jgi:hypothetical protein